MVAAGNDVAVGAVVAVAGVAMGRFNPEVVTVAEAGVVVGRSCSAVEAVAGIGALVGWSCSVIGVTVPVADTD